MGEEYLTQHWLFNTSSRGMFSKGENMRSESEVSNYKSYLRSEIAKMEDKEYGGYNKSLLDTYKAKLATLSYLTKEDKDRKDKLSVCRWLIG